MLHIYSIVFVDVDEGKEIMRMNDEESKKLNTIKKLTESKTTIIIMFRSRKLW